MVIQTEKFRSDLLVLINNCKLDIATAYYVLKDVLHITEKEYVKTLTYEQQQTKETIKEEE